MWQCEIRHEGLHKYRVVKGATPAMRAGITDRVWELGSQTTVFTVKLTDVEVTELTELVTTTA